MLSEQAAPPYSVDDSKPTATLIAQGLEIRYINGQLVPDLAKSKLAVEAGSRRVTVSKRDGLATAWNSFAHNFTAGKIYTIREDASNKDFDLILEEQGSSEKRVFQ